MGIVLCLVLPVLILLCILFLCKRYNFSILPEGMRLPKPKKFKFPEFKRDKGKWEAWNPDDSDSSDYSDDEWEF